MIHWLYLFLLLVTSTSATAPDTPADLKTSEDVPPLHSSKISAFPSRLPSTLKPSHYFVRLQPFINGNFSFNGYVEITFVVVEATNKIIFHLADILTKNETTKVHLVNDTSQPMSLISQEYDKTREFYIATLDHEMTKGESYVLSMNYEGYLNDRLKGFYRSSYKDDQQNTRYLATTQFEPTDARKAFPCFDEPAFKAKFKFEIAREKGMRAVSNMPRIDTLPIEGQNGWFLDRFDTSYPMSTYLIAFVVSDFAYLEANETSNYRFKVWARENAISTAEYAVNLGIRLSKSFEDFFNISYPLPKQDMFAIPDYSTGAMENWGLVIYSESRLLYDPKVSKSEDKFNIASIISHELSHMWFGDLVTPYWWNDLWLKEGFASYVEYIGMRSTVPDMSPMGQFVVRDLHSAFTLDALMSSHPISMPVNTPDEIAAIFDPISYAKGASIIRMMSSFLTEETFKRGLTEYLKEFSYSNAVQNDLWAFLTRQGHADGTLKPDMSVKEIMDTWTLQMGYPLITVQRNKDGSASLSQDRFVLVEGKHDNSIEHEHDYKWWVPITFTSQSEADFKNTAPKVWMKLTDATKVISGMPKAEEWVIFNVGWEGFYRVNYELDNWNMISQQLKIDPSLISESNRAQVIDDSAHLARTECMVRMILTQNEDDTWKLPYETFLGLMTYLKNETDFVPIKAALLNFAFIDDMFLFTEGYGLLKNYLLSLIVPLYDSVGFTESPSDTYLEQVKRSDILWWACKLGHDACVKSAVDLYNQWMQQTDDDVLIPPNLKPIVYCTGIKEGGIEEWKFAWHKYVESNIASEKVELLKAMACSQDMWILARLLNRTISGDQGIRKRMTSDIISAISQSSIGRVVTWEFLRSKWDAIVNFYGTHSFIYEDIIISVTKGLNTPLQMEEMKWFLERYKGRLSSGQAVVEQAAEYTRSNAEWMKNYYDVIMHWLTENGYKSDI